MTNATKNIFKSREGQFSVAGKRLIYPTYARYLVRIMSVHLKFLLVENKAHHQAAETSLKKQTWSSSSCFQLYRKSARRVTMMKSKQTRLIDTTLSTKSVDIILWRSKICCVFNRGWKRGRASWPFMDSQIWRSKTKYTCLPAEDSSFVDLPQLLSMHIVGILCPQCIILSAQYEIEKDQGLLVKNKNSFCISQRTWKSCKTLRRNWAIDSSKSIYECAEEDRCHFPVTSSWETQQRPTAVWWWS